MAPAGRPPFDVAQGGEPVEPRCARHGPSDGVVQWHNKVLGGACRRKLRNAKLSRLALKANQQRMLACVLVSVYC